MLHIDERLLAEARTVSRAAQADAKAARRRERSRRQQHSTYLIEGELLIDDSTARGVAYVPRR